MKFSTTSYLAGVGSVVAALTIGFSGGFFFAAPTQNDPPNRLQRVTSSAPIPNPAPPQAAIAPKQDSPKQETVEAASTPAPALKQEASTAAAPVVAAAPVAPVVAAAPVAPPPAVAAAPASPPPTVAQQAASVAATPAPTSTREPEPVRAADTQERSEREHITQVNTEKARAAEARRAEEDANRATEKAEKKRIEARKLAERRKQREIQEAATAVKRMLRDRDVQQVADTDDESDRRGDDNDRRGDRRGVDSSPRPLFGFFGQ